MTKKNTNFKKRIKLICLIILLVSVYFALSTNESDGTEILIMLPNILGILFSGVLSSLAIILALLSTRELSLINSLDNGFEKYTKFLENAKFDIKVVFGCTVVSIFLSILTKIKMSHIVSLLLKTNLLLISSHLKIQCLLILGFIILFLSLSSILDLIESIFTLSRLKYEATIKINDNPVQEAENE